MKIATLRPPGATAPASLSAESAKLWTELTDAYDIGDPAGKLLLQTALEALQRMREAQEAVSAHGMILKSPRGHSRVNPAIAVERDSRAAMLAALKLLNLTFEPLRAGPGRPGN